MYDYQIVMGGAKEWEYERMAIGRFEWKSSLKRGNKKQQCEAKKTFSNSLVYKIYKKVFERDTSMPQ